MKRRGGTTPCPYRARPRLAILSRLHGACNLYTAPRWIRSTRTRSMLETKRSLDATRRVALWLLALFALALALWLLVLWRYSFWFTAAQPRSTVRDFRISPAQRLLFCSIEKNANTAFSDLLCSLARAGESSTHPPSWWRRLAAQFRTTHDFELGCTWLSASPLNVGMSDEQVWSAFRHEPRDESSSSEMRGAANWTSAVFLRDPLERFLSGYISKCTPGHDPDRYICDWIFGSPNASFAHAVAVMESAAATGLDLPAGTAGDHFRRQSSFCNGTVGTGRFDLYYLLTRETSRRDTIDMLRHVGVENPSEASPSFDHHFPLPGERLHAPMQGGDHTTQAASGMRSVYYNHPALVRGLLRYYAPDYKNSPAVLTVPRWAVEMVGRPFVRDLGLDA